MKIRIATAIQRMFGLFGFQVRRIESGVKIEDVLEEQLGLRVTMSSVSFEVGAANGRDCLVYAARCPKATIHAYEPLPSNFEKLQACVRSERRIVPVAAAVAGMSGTASFHITSLDDASSLFKPQATGSTFDKYVEEKSVIDVPVVTLDEECTRLRIDRIDLLKMDAQGAELEILHGAVSLLDTKAIRVIYTEVNFMRIYDRGCVYHELASFLSDKGSTFTTIIKFTTSMEGLPGARNLRPASTRVTISYPAG